MIGREVWRAVRLIVGQGEKIAGAGRLQRMAGPAFDQLQVVVNVHDQ